MVYIKLATMCKCGRDIKCKKTGECKRCYDRRRYKEATQRTNAWRHKNCIKQYRPVSKVKADNKKMKAQLRTLAERECDNCQERDCADCWAMEYNKTRKV